MAVIGRSLIRYPSVWYLAVYNTLDWAYIRNIKPERTPSAHNVP